MDSFQHSEILNFDEDGGDKCKAWIAEPGLAAVILSFRASDWGPT
jgi:hypothetical protein